MSGYPNQYSGYGTDDPSGYGAGGDSAGSSHYTSTYGEQPNVVGDAIWPSTTDTGDYTFYDPSFYPYMDTADTAASGIHPDGGAANFSYSNSPLYQAKDESPGPDGDDGGGKKKSKAKEHSKEHSKKHSGSSGGGSGGGGRGGSGGGGGGPSSGETVLRCTFPDCGRKFTHHWEFNKHVKQHERPLKCDQCGESKAHRRDLDRHYVVHHPERALEMGLTVERSSCYVKGCTETFARKDHLKRHLKNKHCIIEKDK